MDKKETIKIQGRSSGMWFTRKKDAESSSVKDMPQAPPRVPESTKSTPRATPPRSKTLWLSDKPIVEEPSQEPSPVKKATGTSTVARRRPSRSATAWPGKVNNIEHTKDDIGSPERPGHQKSRSETAVVQVQKRKQTSSSESKEGNTIINSEQATN